MTGQELHGLFLRVGVPNYIPWSSWDDTHPRTQQAFDAVAALLNERQAEAVYEAAAGEDI